MKTIHLGVESQEQSDVALSSVINDRNDNASMKKPVVIKTISDKYSNVLDHGKPILSEARVKGFDNRSSDNISLTL